jgi:hypothetical protein
MVVLVVALALGMFAAAEAVESYFRKKEGS